MENTTPTYHYPPLPLPTPTHPHPLLTTPTLTFPYHPHPFLSLPTSNPTYPYPPHLYIPLTTPTLHITTHPHPYLPLPTPTLLQGQGAQVLWIYFYILHSLAYMPKIFGTPQTYTCTCHKVTSTVLSTGMYFSGKLYAFVVMCCDDTW